MSFSRRRSTDNDRAFTTGLSDITGIRSDYHRLRLLENAVINYSGGRKKLEIKVRNTASRIKNIDNEAAAVLYDVAVYLREVAVAGGLDDENFYEMRDRRWKRFS